MPGELLTPPAFGKADVLGSLGTRPGSRKLVVGSRAFAAPGASRRPALFHSE